MEQGETPDAAHGAAAGGVSFAAMYDAHVDEVYRFVFRRCRDHALSEDITQETFMAAIRTTDDPRSISIGWLMTVARNQLVDVLRRQTRYEGKLRLVGAAGRAEHDVEQVERMRVEAALNELTVDHRLVLTLHYIDGYTVRALAEHLDRSMKAVESMMTRARRALRAKLDEGADGAERGGRHD
jgi:RNA polymerase sigma-70 factor (ECF subfamily)